MNSSPPSAPPSPVPKPASNPPTAANASRRIAQLAPYTSARPGKSWSQSPRQRTLKNDSIPAGGQPAGRSAGQSAWIGPPAIATRGSQNASRRLSIQPGAGPGVVVEVEEQVVSGRGGAGVAGAGEPGDRLAHDGHAGGHRPGERLDAVDTLYLDDRSSRKRIGDHRRTYSLQGKRIEIKKFADKRFDTHTEPSQQDDEPAIVHYWMVGFNNAVVIILLDRAGSSKSATVSKLAKRHRASHSKYATIQSSAIQT